jgi:hypothetical protein
VRNEAGMLKSLAAIDIEQRIITRISAKPDETPAPPAPLEDGWVSPLPRS